MNTCGLCEHDLTSDHYLCPRCTTATAQRLDRMPRLYDALAAFLHPTSRRPEPGPTQPGNEPPLPGNEHVLTLRGPGGIVSILEDWRTAMQNDRGWGPPATGGTTGHRITAAARGLTLNLDWITTHWPMAGALAEELRDLERSILTIVNPPERTIRVGDCAARLPDGTICGAALRATPGAPEIRCGWCHTSYPPDTWLTLATGTWADTTEGAA